MKNKSRLCYTIFGGFMGKNYDKLLQELLEVYSNKNQVPRILLHSCCAPCSSYVIEYLSKYCELTILYYNPNISPQEEYEKRKMEQQRFLEEFPTTHPVHMIDCDYENEVYEQVIQGLEQEPERGRRCTLCFRLRLEKTAKIAKENHFDYFGTTLTVSPYKNSDVINEIGLSIEKEQEIPFLVADFKKQNGYKRSIELSKDYHLYRQNYCGCQYSKKD